MLAKLAVFAAIAALDWRNRHRLLPRLTVYGTVEARRGFRALRRSHSWSWPSGWRLGWCPGPPPTPRRPRASRLSAPRSATGTRLDAKLLPAGPGHTVLGRSLPAPVGYRIRVSAVVTGRTVTATGRITVQ
ncbi:hypothetical protein BH20ACT9_BH20ACT9_13000 [soil metagenome]